MATDPLITVEGQDYYAKRDKSRGVDCLALIVTEQKPVEIMTPDCITLGREICLDEPNTGVLPDCDLCGVMGKELDCEGQNGTVRVVWCTTRAMDGKVYASSVSSSGPWTLVASTTTTSYCHDVTFSMLAIGQQWFYVESTSSACGTLTSGVYTFCTEGLIIIEPPIEWYVSCVTEIVPLSWDHVPVIYGLDGAWGDHGEDGGENEILAPGCTTELLTVDEDYMQYLGNESIFNEFGTVTVS